MFNYTLPPDRIARYPAQPRDSARLLVLDRQDGTLSAFVARPEDVEPLFHSYNGGGLKEFIDLLTFGRILGESTD